MPNMVRRYAKYYFTVKGKYLQGRMVNRMDFFLFIFCDFIIQLINVVFFLVLFTHIPSLKGWNRDEVMLVYGIFQLSYGLFGFFFWPLYDFGYLLVTGAFDSVLMRPISSLFQLLSKGMGDIGGVVLGTGLVVYAVGKRALIPTPLHLGMLLLFLIGGILLYICLYTLVAAASFWMEQSSGGLHNILSITINFAKYPLSIYSKALRNLLTWFIPLGFIGFYPASYFFSNEWSSTLWYMPLVVVGFMLLTAFIWRRGLRRYRGAGN